MATLRIYKNSISSAVSHAIVKRNGSFQFRQFFFHFRLIFFSLHIRRVLLSKLLRKNELLLRFISLIGYTTHATHIEIKVHFSIFCAEIAFADGLGPIIKCPECYLFHSNYKMHFYFELSCSNRQSSLHPMQNADFWVKITTLTHEDKSY